MKARSLWCIVKSVAVREEPNANSPEVGRIEFGKQVIVEDELTGIANGRIMVCSYDSYEKDNKKKIYIKGWVLRSAFTEQKVEEYAKLHFDNLTGKRLPVKDSYRGKQVGWILPGEQVSVIAKVGNLCLTSKGWTGFHWLTKNREIFDQAGIGVLLYGVLEWAAKDYRSIVRNIKMYKYNNREEFCDMMKELENIILWFISDEYSMMFDPIPGRERLDDMNEELGIDKKWLKEKFRIRDAVVDKIEEKKRKKRVRKHRDSSGRHKESGGSAQECGSLLFPDGDRDCQAET